MINYKSGRKDEMQLVIVTGMSGAGKTQAINALEDIGFFCVDNIPPRLITKFAELPSESGNHISNIALVVDVRSHELFGEYNQCLDELKNKGVQFKTLFLDCNSSVLLQRYKETRRRHPLQSEENISIEQAIWRERKMIAEVQGRADFVMDTSMLSAARLRAKIRDLFVSAVGGAMVVICTSFGFKHGIPADSDLIFDVRCLPNPFYDKEMRGLTGRDASVRDFVLRSKQAKGLKPKLLGLIDYLIPLYIQEGKSQLVISIGCTGGRHRSVVFCEMLAAHFNKSGIAATVSHRDMHLLAEE